MSLASEPLPANLSALRIFAADLQAELARKDIEIAANAAEIHAKTLHIEKLKMQLAVLRRARFGRSSEKLNRDIEQLELLIGALEQDAAAEDVHASTAEPDTTTDPKTPAKTPQRSQPVRTPLPAHLPRETVTHEPACICAGCGGTTFSRIGQDEREVLEYVPSSFKVIQHVRPKLSCRSCETIVQAPMPSLPIERGRPGPGLLAHVLVSSIVTTRRCTVSRSSMPAKASISIAPRWPIGSERRSSCSLPWLRRSDGMFAPAPRCMPTTRPFPCSRPAWGRPKPDGYGSSCATSGPGTRRCHRQRSIATRRIAKASMRRRCLALAGAFCMPMGMPGSKGSTGQPRPTASRRWSRLHAGATHVASSTRSTTLQPRQSPWRPWSESPPCSPSRAASADNHPSSVWPRANSTPGRCWCNWRRSSTRRSAG